MDKIKELTDFYMWMQENEYNLNIRASVEKKVGMYLNMINVEQNEQFICDECNKITKEWLYGICEDCTLKGFT